VKSQSNWSDFVFKKDYELPSLEEVSSFIREKGHLPDVPSAESVEKNGIHLGNMDATLLQKIEELTLYAIEQNERSEHLQDQVRRYRTRLKTQSQQITRQKQAIKSLREDVRALKSALEKIDDRSKSSEVER